MKTANQKPGLWKPWKNKLRFSTVPTAPAANDKNKSSQTKNKTRSFTQNT
jgi:hypothetical protein